MNTADLLKTVKTLSSKEINALLRNMKRKPKTSEKKKRVSFNLKINNQLFKQTVNGNDVIKHFMETLIPDLKFMPPYAIKAQIVSMFEMLAEAEEYKSRKDRWRQRAAKVVVIDNQEHLFAYVATLATDIRM